MRIDKFLKVSRVIKRRTVASEACTNGRIKINEKVAKPSSEVKVGDIVEIVFGDKTLKFRILKVCETVKVQDVDSLIEYITTF